VRGHGGSGRQEEKGKRKRRYERQEDKRGEGVDNMQEVRGMRQEVTGQEMKIQVSESEMHRKEIKRKKLIRSEVRKN
jgi:hypothetical protein